LRSRFLLPAALLLGACSNVGGLGAVLELFGNGRPALRRIVLISVNSERRTGLAIDRSGKIPSIFSVVGAMMYSGLGRQSMESSLVFRDSVEEWRRGLKADARYGPEADFDIFNIEINLSEVGDPALREQVLDIPTAFRISAVDFELLRRAAALSLARSADFQRFLQSTAHGQD
jgi:NTE family protein